MYVNTKIDGDCCQTYGLCGEQYSLDVIFNDRGVVTASRFRFQHTTMKSQEDYIRGLLETRRAADKFGVTLIPYDNEDDEGVQVEFETDDPFYSPPRTYLQELTDYVGITAPMSAKRDIETVAPITFTYSLYYVYYDQYTYIRGVLFQNVFIAIGAIIVAMQLITSLSISLIIAVHVFLVFFELMGLMWMFNVVLGHYPAEMNAVFVVNLVTSLGFGVEFCNHIGMNFMK